jgi:hypothetical protein
MERTPIRIAALVFTAILTVGLPARAVLTDPLEDIESVVQQRQGDLPADDLTKDQKKQARSYKKALKKLGKDRSTLAGQLKVAKSAIPVLDKAHPGDSNMAATLDSVTGSLRDEVLTFLQDVQARLDAAPAKVTPEKVQNLIDKADDKVSGSVTATSRKKEFNDLSKAEKLLRKADAQIAKIKPGGGSGRCGQGRALANGESYRATIGSNGRWIGGAFQADEVHVRVLRNAGGDIVSIALTAYSCQGSREQAVSVVVAPPFSGTDQPLALAAYKEDFTASFQGSFAGTVTYKEWDEAKETMAIDFESEINDGAGKVVPIEGTVRIPKFDKIDTL